MWRQLERARRALWVLKQPLTEKPALSGAAVSDLFVWRYSEDWETYFELTDIPGLFVSDGERESDRFATVMFFNNNGAAFLEKRFDLIPHQRQTVDLSAFVSAAGSTMGTFCVFHSRTPRAVSDLGSYIAERGYVSYRFKKAPLRTYAHGNLDAIALLPDKNTQLLGSRSFLAREYRLQHELRGPAQYELGIVNPSRRSQRFFCRVVSTRDDKVLETQVDQIPPRGCHVFQVPVNEQPVRLVIKSHLVMARPLVFRIQDQKMDVFHG